MKRPASIWGEWQRSAVILAGILAVLVLTSCNGFEPGTVSPLAGNWYGASRNPGVTYTGKIAFDFGGDLVELDLTSVQNNLEYTFDGQVHGTGSDGYSATAKTTLKDDTFSVKGFVEYTQGKNKGLTYITVEGTVRYGSMAGTVEVNYPSGDSLLFDFDATRRD